MRTLVPSVPADILRPHESCPMMPQPETSPAFLTRASRPMPPARAEANAAALVVTDELLFKLDNRRWVAQPRRVLAVVYLVRSALQSTFRASCFSGLSRLTLRIVRMIASSLWENEKESNPGSRTCTGKCRRLRQLAIGDPLI